MLIGVLNFMGESVSTTENCSIQKRIITTLKYSGAAWLEFIVTNWPESYVGNKLRLFYWKKKYNLTSYAIIGKNSKLNGDKKNISMGENFLCGTHVEINFCDSNGLYIGNHVAIAKGSYIRSGNHKTDRLDLPVMFQGHESAVIPYQGKNYSIVIEDDVWIGAHVILLSGTKIGKGSVIAAGSVVSTEIPPYSIVVGNPARVARSRLKKIHESFKYAKKI